MGVPEEEIEAAWNQSRAVFSGDPHDFKLFAAGYRAASRVDEDETRAELERFVRDALDFLDGSNPYLGERDRLEKRAQALVARLSEPSPEPAK